MEEINFEGLDAKLEAERRRLVTALRAITDRLERLSPAEAADRLSLLVGSVDAFVRRARAVLR